MEQGQKERVTECWVTKVTKHYGLAATPIPHLLFVTQCDGEGGRSVGNERVKFSLGGREEKVLSVLSLFLIILLYFLTGNELNHFSSS